MTLTELITALEAADPNLTVPDGFTHPHSYRGYYDELAFEPASNVTVAEMLADARSALGETFQGWKGGDYTMDGSTDCWLALEGCAGGETLGPLMVKLMLGTEGAPTVPDPTAPTKTREGDQPLPTPGRECVQDALVQLIEDRKQLGLKRYGSALMTHNGRDAARDALEEALDLTVYLMQVQMEAADDKAELGQLRAARDRTLLHMRAYLRDGPQTILPQTVIDLLAPEEAARRG